MKLMYCLCAIRTRPRYRDGGGRDHRDFGSDGVVVITDDLSRDQFGLLIGEPL